MRPLLTEAEVRLIVDALRSSKGDGPAEPEERGLATRLEEDWRKFRQELDDYAGEIEQARDEYARPSDDDLEIDDEPILSIADDGVWVNAWVWVRNAEDEEEDDE